MYYAVIGDIISSKKLPDRFAVQEKLTAILGQFNEEYEEDLASNFIITIGDEFQGLLRKGDHVLEIIDKINILMYPVQIRFGIGIGEIKTRINKLSIGADGPAYWHAREAILKVHEDNDYGTAKLMVSAQENPNLILMINEILRLCDYIESRWRETQKNLVETAILNYGHSLTVKQTDLAEKLNLTNQALNQRIQSSGYYSYIRARNQVATILSTEWRGEDER